MDTTVVPTILGPEFLKEQLPKLMDAIQHGQEWGVRMAWHQFYLPLLKEHWFAVFLIAVSLFILAMINAVTGRWGSLGSLLYWFYYALFALPICLFWDPAVLISDIFHIVYLLVLWPVCYRLSGWTMDRLGVGPHHPRW